MTTTWEQISNKIGQLGLSTVRKLSQTDLDGAQSMLVDNQKNVDLQNITHEQFKVFWPHVEKWLSAVEQMKADWDRSKLITGLLTRSESEQFLNKYLLPGAFLVRFSTSSAGQLTASYVNDSREIKHVRLFTNPNGTVTIELQDGEKRAYTSLHTLIKACNLFSHAVIDGVLVDKKTIC